MARIRRHADVSVYLPHAIAATALVACLPAGFVVAGLAWSGLEPIVFFAGVMGIALSVALALVGSSLWRRRPESVDIAFGELMLWSWYRRKRAEEKLAHGERTLTQAKREWTPRRLHLPREERLSALQGMSGALEVKDPYTHGHSRRVSRAARRTALALGLSEDDIEILTTAASLHDVGKIRVPARIIRKPGPLTSDERELMQDHTLVGAWMVAGLGDEDITAAVRQHHERWDGQGYPDRVGGNEIHLFARIISVADSFDAMTSVRPYRPSLGHRRALDVLEAEAGRQFDPVVVEAFVETAPVRTAALAFIPLLLGPRRIGREIAAWFKNSGIEGVAPAAGAAGAAVVMGASLLGGTVFNDRPRPPEVLSNDISASGTDTSVKTSAAAEDPGSRRDDNATTARSARDENGPKKERRQPRARGTGDTAQTHDTGRKDDAPSPPSQEEKDKEDSSSSPSSKPSPPEETPVAETPEGDPQPEHGRDCSDHPEGGAGAGNDKHCGN